MVQTSDSAQRGAQRKRLVAHISDLHFDGSDDQRRALAEELARVRRLDPDLILISGDLTDDGTHAQYAEVADALRVLDGIPTLAIPGNRDVRGCPTRSPDTADAKRARRAFRSLSTGEPLSAARPDDASRFARYFGAPNMVFSDDDVCVVGLDSNRKVPGRVLEAARTAFLGAAAGATRILVVHHPLVPVPHKKIADGDFPRNVGDLWSLILECDVQLVCSGHHHRSHVASVGWKPLAPVTLSMAPMLTVTTRKKHRGIHLVRLAGGAVDVQQLRTDAEDAAEHTRLATAPAVH